MVSISKVCDKQQDTFNNQSISIHGKLWKTVENGYRFEKKRKNGKSNGIHREDEKGTRRGWGDINEDTGENEEARRERKIES